MNISSSSRNQADRRARNPQGGFTIAEVMFSALILILAIATSVTTLNFGFRILDTARCTTIASQVLQSMMEDTRLQNWTQITTLEAAANNGVAGNAVIDSSFTGYSSTAAALLSRFTVTRTISDTTQTNMKLILFVITWTGVDGRTHTVSYSSYYAKDGIYDFYVS